MFLIKSRIFKRHKIGYRHMEYMTESDNFPASYTKPMSGEASDVLGGRLYI